MPGITKMHITYILIVPILTESRAAKFFHKRGYAVAGHTDPTHLLGAVFKRTKLGMMLRAALF